MLIINNEIKPELMDEPDTGLDCLKKLVDDDNLDIERLNQLEKEIQYFKENNIDIFLCLRYHFPNS